MNAHYFGPKCSQLILAAIVSVFFAGCANQPLGKSTQSSRLSEMEGKWFWSQKGPWHGYFVLEKDGDEYKGKLDDIFEETYGDPIEDVVISDDHIKFTRNGAYGIQYWEGVLKVEDDLLKIVDGRWEKQGGFLSGTFFAEKRD